jgi:hypothetical protein
MGAQQQAALPIDIEGVHGIARGVVGGDVHQLKVVAVPLYLGPFHGREAHVGEDADNLLQRLAHRVRIADGRTTAGQGHVEPLGGQVVAQARLFQRLRALPVQALQDSLDPVVLATRSRPFLCWKRVPQLVERAALAAQVADAPLLERGLVGDGRQLGLGFLVQRD